MNPNAREFKFNPGVGEWKPPSATLPGTIRTTTPQRSRPEPEVSSTPTIPVKIAPKLDDASGY